MAKEVKFSKEELSGYFEYLDDLRKSGVTNMFGASSYFQEEFEELDRNSSKKVLGLWMNTFRNDKSPEERAELAFKKF